MHLQQEFFRKNESFDKELNFEAAYILVMRQKVLSKLSDNFLNLQQVQQHILDRKLGAVSQIVCPIFRLII